jgi:hypothetical protein
MLGSHDLDAINWLEGAVNAAPADQVALIRTARLHQDAVWIAEQEPELAWLMLVSALETGAGRWDRSAGSPIDQVPNFQTETCGSIGRPVFRFDSIRC